MRVPATTNDEGLADLAAANPFRLPRLHPGIASPVPARVVLTCHPFISGRASRVALTEDLVRYLRRQSGVWFTTCEEGPRWHDKQRA